jgi:hypothetical protein
MIVESEKSLEKLDILLQEIEPITVQKSPEDGFRINHRGILGDEMGSEIVVSYNPDKGGFLSYKLYPDDDIYFRARLTSDRVTDINSQAKDPRIENFDDVFILLESVNKGLKALRAWRDLPIETRKMSQQKFLMRISDQGPLREGGISNPDDGLDELLEILGALLD